jgi:hypothetical protein
MASPQQKDSLFPPEEKHEGSRSPVIGSPSRDPVIVIVGSSLTFVVSLARDILLAPRHHAKVIIGTRTGDSTELRKCIANWARGGELQFAVRQYEYGAVDTNALIETAMGLWGKVDSIIHVAR